MFRVRKPGEVGGEDDQSAQVGELTRAQLGPVEAGEQTKEEKVTPIKGNVERVTPKIGERRKGDAKDGSTS